MLPIKKRLVEDLLDARAVKDATAWARLEAYG
jgi:hypothetical protein